MKILVCGHGRSGKDTACEYLEQATGLKNAGTTSKYLARHMAKLLGVTPDKAFATRHQMRELWYNEANRLRENDPLLLIREAFANGDISGGIRDLAEIRAARISGVADIIIWIENVRVPQDPTLMFDSRECDLIIQNNWGLEEFYLRLDKLAKLIRGIKPF